MLHFAYRCFSLSLSSGGILDRIRYIRRISNNPSPLPPIARGQQSQLLGQQRNPPLFSERLLMIGVCSTWTPLLQSAYHNFNVGITITAMESHCLCPLYARIQRTGRTASQASAGECERGETCGVCTSGRPGTPARCETRTGRRARRATYHRAPLPPASSPKEFAAPDTVAHDGGATPSKKRGTDHPPSSHSTRLPGCVPADQPRPKPSYPRERRGGGCLPRRTSSEANTVSSPLCLFRVAACLSQKKLLPSHRVGHSAVSNLVSPGVPPARHTKLS